jgi:hypothetical protein
MILREVVQDCVVDLVVPSHEEAVRSAINELYPNGELDHKAGHRDNYITKHLKASDRSHVSRRVIERTLKKIEFA